MRGYANSKWETQGGGGRVPNPLWHRDDVSSSFEVLPAIRLNPRVKVNFILFRSFKRQGGKTKQMLVCSKYRNTWEYTGNVVKVFFSIRSTKGNVRQWKETDFGTRRNRSSCQTSSEERNTRMGGAIHLPTGAVLRSGKFTGFSATQPWRPDIQARDVAVVRRSLGTLSNENGEGDGDLRLSGKIQIIICASLMGKSLTFCVRPRRVTSHFDVGWKRVYSCLPSLRSKR